MHTETLIILDWDDTLFPTSWVSNNNINLFDKSIREKHQISFSELDNILYLFLQKCIGLGKVIIITNASIGWIVVSMSILPNVSRLINSKISILSARDAYQNSTNMENWKKLAFEEEVYNYFNGKYDLHNIVSIGDAHYEYNALIKLYDWDKIVPQKKLLKTIKFMNIPTYKILIDQINVLVNCISKICKKQKHVDLQFNKI